MTEIEFIFCVGNGVVSRIINWRTYGDWSHVAIRILPETTKNCIVEASMKRGVSLTSLAKIKEESEKVVYKKIMSSKSADELESIGMSQVGKPYDYMAIGGAFLRIGNWYDNASWYCSELATFIAYQMGVKLFEKTEKIITPQMLYTALSPQIVTAFGEYK